MKKTLYAYIFQEIPPPFIAGMVTFTFMLLMGRFLKLAEMVVEKGVPFLDVVRMVSYLLPSFWLFTIPMALLLAILLAFGRLSSDSEVTAMKSCGISLYGMLPPPLTFSLVAAAGCLWVTVYAVPWGASGFKKLMVEIAQNSAAVVVKEKVFNNAFPGMVIYADSLGQGGETMEGVIVHDERDPKNSSTIFARSGALLSDTRSRSIEFHLKDGSIHRGAEKGSYQMVHFQDYSLRVALAATEAAPLKVSEMSLDQLRNPAPGTDPKKKLAMELEYHGRLALPFSCIVFGLLAVPLGIQNRRSGKASGFSMSIAVILVYYVTLSAFDTVGERGLIAPVAAAWAPNLIFLLIGAYLLRQAASEQPLPLALVWPRLTELVTRPFVRAKR
jgi:lipopolysaccharide export system permease protein